MNIDPNLVIFYVDSPEKSALFYEDLFGSKPIDLAPTFALFNLKPGLRLGLWSKRTALPKSLICGGGGELSVQVASDADVDSLHQQWTHKKINIIQTPTSMDFGYTFVAVDPDQHRIRIFNLKS